MVLFLALPEKELYSCILERKKNGSGNFCETKPAMRVSLLIFAATSFHVGKTQNNTTESLKGSSESFVEVKYCVYVVKHTVVTVSAPACL